MKLILFRSIGTCLIILISFFASSLCAEDFRVGATLSLTGPYAHYGSQALHGIEMAVDEINRNGGVNGKTVKLIVEDFGTLDLKRAAQSAQKLINKDKVDLFLPLIVEDSEVVVPLTTRAHLFTMVVGCGARKCGTSLGQYNVRAPSSHDTIIEKLVDHAVKRGMKHACIIAAQATYFEAYGRYIEELAKKNGATVSYEEVPLSNSEDYREIALKFNHEQCDAIFPWIPIGSSGAFFKRVRESKSPAQIYGIVETDDPGIISVAGKAAEGVIFANFSLGSEQFLKRYKERYHEVPSRPAVPAYDGVKLLLTLAGKVGTDPKKLLQAFKEVKDYPAENGIITYTETGERLGEKVQLMQIKNGAAVSLE